METFPLSCDAIERNGSITNIEDDLMKCLTSKTAMTLVFLAIPGAAFAAEREVVIYNWLGGSEAEMMEALGQGFEQAYPEIEVRFINPGSGSDDQRAGIRTALLGGETFDLVVNAWPSFEAELVDNGLARPLDETWDAKSWSDALNDSWRNMAMRDGKTYAVYFLSGYRSGMWYRKDTLAEIDVAAPETWGDLIASCDSFTAAELTTTFIGARSWAQTEWFENALLKTAGVEFARRLAALEANWTDEEVKQTLRNLRQLVEANCTQDADTMLSTHWSDGADAVLQNATAGYVLIGSWINNRAVGEYGLVPGEDYSYVVFPAIEAEHANAISVDGKSLISLATGENPEEADLFIDYAISAQGTEIIASYNQASPSLHTNTSAYDPIVKAYVEELQTADVLFVLDDLLPAELSSEFRIALQEFLRDPSDETIDAVTARLQARAEALY